MSRLPDPAPAAGYLHPAYAASLAEFGAPYCLPASGGWVLERTVPGGASPNAPAHAGHAHADLAHDAMGCYPLFACRNWQCLPGDLEAVGRRWVSLAVVADPFGPGESVLRRAFPDRVLPFKPHFVVDLQRPAHLPSHHRRKVRAALRSVRVEVCADPPALLDTWVALYGNLIDRHRIGGLRAFSRSAFAGALRVPGIVALVATAGGETVGAQLWYVQGEVAYSHLVASSPGGYALGAAYALHWFALDYFKGRVQWLDLGGGAGATAASQGEDGLARFKQGWATETRMAWFCGRIFDRPRYAALAGARGVTAGGYFPAYRQGEFL
jgi:hypothetical protein